MIWSLLNVRNIRTYWLPPSSPRKRMENEIVVIMSLGSNFQKAIFKIPGMEILYKKHLFFPDENSHI